MNIIINGHKITLRSGHQDAGMWTCQYVVVKFGNTDRGKRSGYADGSSRSHQDAEAAALGACPTWMKVSYDPDC